MESPQSCPDTTISINYFKPPRPWLKWTSNCNTDKSLYNEGDYIPKYPRYKSYNEGLNEGKSIEKSNINLSDLDLN